MTLGFQPISLLVHLGNFEWSGLGGSRVCCHHFNQLSNMFSQQSDIAASKSSIAMHSGHFVIFPGNFFKSLSFVVAFQVHEDGMCVLNRRIGIEMNTSMANLTPSKNIGQMTLMPSKIGEKKSEPRPQSPPLL